jgi:hypothetical protein
MTDTTTRNAAAFVVTGIDASVADELRAAGGVTYVADSSGYPCRQCLRDAAIGDVLILVSYDPFTGSSPYRSASPIFLHLSPCTPDDIPSGSADLPNQLMRRTLSVRAFDSTEMMLDAALIDGAELAGTIHRLLDNDDAHHLHIHNEPRGCWAARVDRQGSSACM